MTDRRKSPPVPREDSNEKPEWDDRQYRSKEDIKNDPKFNTVVPVHPDDLPKK